MEDTGAWPPARLRAKSPAALPVDRAEMPAHAAEQLPPNRNSQAIQSRPRANRTKVMPWTTKMIAIYRRGRCVIMGVATVDMRNRCPPD